jgi:hypothetical protein
MCDQDRGLPVARLRPRDAGEQLVVLRGKATDGARRVGHVAAVTTKAVAMIALCGAGVFLVGASHATYSRTPSYHFELDRNVLQNFKPSLYEKKYTLPRWDYRLKDIRLDTNPLSKWRAAGELPAPMPAELPATSAP